jgi:hypothetical protein
MSYSSRIDSPAHWVGYGAKWFVFRLTIYVAIAVISAGLFFVAASVYAYVSPVAFGPADDALPRQVPISPSSILEPNRVAPAPVGRLK